MNTQLSAVSLLPASAYHEPTSDTEAQALWARVKTALCAELTPMGKETLNGTLTTPGVDLVSMTKTKVTLTAAPFARSWLNAHHHDALKALFKQAEPGITKVEILDRPLVRPGNPSKKVAEPVVVKNLMEGRKPPVYVTPVAKKKKTTFSAAPAWRPEAIPTPVKRKPGPKAQPKATIEPKAKPAANEALPQTTVTLGTASKVETIIDILCEKFETLPETFQPGKGIPTLRQQMAIYFTKKVLPDLSNEEVGQALGGFRPNVVQRAYDTHEERLKANEGTADTFKELELAYWRRSGE